MPKKSKSLKYSHRRLKKHSYSNQRIVFNSIPRPERIIANFTGVTRNDTMDGKDYLVAPMIMVVEGILEGSSGPMYYPASELAKTPAVWNMKPVVVDHPQRNGYGISACDPDIIKNRGVGLIMNTVFEDGKLKAEAWIDIDKAKIVDNRIIEAIENKAVMELSTGLFTDNESKEGEFNGVAYSSIARNYRPDHLALLPDSIGACSVEDGAGFLRLNEAHDGIIIDVTTFASDEREYVLKNDNGTIEKISSHMIDLIKNEISHSDVWSLLSSLLRADNEDFWIDEVFDSFFIYIDDGVLYKQSYSINDGQATFIGTREKVTREIVFKTEDGSVLNNTHIRKDLDMKKKIIDALIANEATQWKEDDREALMAMEEAVLNKLTPVVNEEQAEVVRKAKEAFDQTQTNEEDSDTENKPMTPKEYIANAPSEIAAVLNQNMATYNAEKAKLIEAITANKKCSFTKEQLESKEVGELKQIASLAVNKKKTSTIPTDLNYTGQQETTDNADSEKEEPLELPTMNFEPEKATA